MTAGVNSIPFDGPDQHSTEGQSSDLGPSGSAAYIIKLRKTGGKKIYVDPLEREGIYLYPGEVRKEKLEEGQEMTEEELLRLRLVYALPRARKRALGILAKRDQTESQIRDKLEKSLTDSRSLEEALDFVKKHGYVNDYKYACDYLFAKRGRKSFRQIRMDLIGKGISREILDQVFEENREQDAGDLKELFEKYIRRFPAFDRDAARKTYAHFMRKGYASDLVSGMIRRKQEEWE